MSIITSNVTEATPNNSEYCGNTNIAHIVRQMDKMLTADYHCNNKCFFQAFLSEYPSKAMQAKPMNPNCGCTDKVVNISDNAQILNYASAIVL